MRRPFTLWRMKGIALPACGTRNAPASRFAVGLKIVFGVLVVLSVTVLCPRLALGQEDEYVGIYATVQQADSLIESKQPDAALAKYRDAQDALRRFQLRYPNWNKNVVNFRLNYLAEKITSLTTKPVEPTST